jgi:hypothetical protein
MPQGVAPPDWPAAERSLSPEACGGCHVERYAEWHSSLHAHALSLGLVGQLITFDTAQIESCLNCHAPLAEQKQAFLARLRGDAKADPASVPAGAGNSCATCHVRAHRHYGPPARPQFGNTDRAQAHGGVERSADFEKSEFCSACHQFPAAAAINGKPLENTYAEWRGSPFAERNQSCQSCHMPDRRHLWRGIHDPAMVASGLTPSQAVNFDEVQFTVTNSGVGHYFPTYATPKVILRAVALDDHGEVVVGSSAALVIQRMLMFGDGGWHEISDTRLAPGTSATLHYPWRGFRTIRVWLEVYPDDYYREHVYPELIKQMEPASASARMLELAVDQVAHSSYRLFESAIRRPGQGVAPRD